MAGLPEDPYKLPLRRVWPFLESSGLETEADEIRASRDKIRGYSTSSLRRGKVIQLLKRHDLLDRFVTDCWPNGATENGKALIRGSETLYERFLQGADEGVDEELNEDEQEELADSEFAHESDLRDYLANNLTLIESGLHLWPVADDETAIEYRVDGRGRRIDILAQDSAGVPVVIELKVSKGHERAVGQALYYRGRVKELMKCDRVRVVLVAKEISPELKLATQDVPDSQLFEYELSMTVSELG